MTTRAAYTEGLRKLADALDQHPLIPLPLEGGWSIPLGVYIHDRDGLEPALVLQLLMTDVTTERTSSLDFPVEITGRLSGLLVQVRVAAEIALLPGVVLPVPAAAFDPRLGDVA